MTLCLGSRRRCGGRRWHAEARLQYRLRRRPHRCVSGSVAVHGGRAPEVLRTYLSTTPAAPDHRCQSGALDTWMPDFCRGQSVDKQLECRIIITHVDERCFTLGMYDPLNTRYEPLGKHPTRDIERIVGDL